MTSEAQADLGGLSGDRWSLPKTVRCPRCGAGVNVKCRNPISGLEAHAACEVRNKAASVAKASTE